MKLHNFVGAATILTMVLSACTPAPAAPTAAPASVATTGATPAAVPPTTLPATQPPATNTVASTIAPSPAVTTTVAAVPSPTATYAPVVAADLTQANVVKTTIPPIQGKPLAADIMEVNQATNLLYLADRVDNGIDVFDVSTTTPKYLRTIALPSGPNGVTVAPDLNKLFAGLTDSTVAIIDINPKSAKPDSLITTLSTGGKARADEMDYDPKDKKLYVANSDDGIVTSIDAVNNTIIKKFTNLGPALEQPRYNPKDGMMYLTGSGANVLFQFDPSKDVLVKTIDVGDNCHPNGLAINPTTNIALLGCSVPAPDQHIVVWDLTTQKVKATYTNVGGTDATIYDAKADRFFSGSSGFFRGPVVGIFNGADGKFLTNVPVTVGGHQVAYDEASNIVIVGDAPDGAIQSFVRPK